MGDPCRDGQGASGAARRSQNTWGRKRIRSGTAETVATFILTLAGLVGAQDAHVVVIIYSDMTSFLAGVVVAVM